MTDAHRRLPAPDVRMSTIETLAEIVGEEAAVKLVVRYGGLRLYIPKEPPPGGDLVGAVGYKNAVLLGRRYGGTHFDLPLQRAKRERIAMHSKRGLKVRDIAELVGCTERHVKQVRAELRANGGELSHFDEHADPDQVNLFDGALK